MRILFVSEQFPYPLDTGGNVRTFHLLKALGQSHDVTLIASAEEPVAEEHLRLVAEMCCDIRIVRRAPRSKLREGREFIFGAFGQMPFLLARHYLEAVRREIQAVCGTGTGDCAQKMRTHIDAVHFNHLDAALYWHAVPGAVPCILDEHNVVSNQVQTMSSGERHLGRRLVISHEHRRMREMERRLCNRMTKCLVCSERDGESLLGLGVKRPLAVIPNGVDLDYFSMPLTDERRASGIVFVGTLDYEPCERGVWYFCTEVLPLLHRELPALQFTVVGRNPSRRLRLLAESERRVVLTGRVEDVRPYVYGAKAVVVPLLSGSGTRLKILEALALGTPVVSTAIGAEGLEACQGEDLLIANDPLGIAEGVLSVLRDRMLASRLRRGGRELVEKKYGWPAISARLLSEYATLQPATE